MEAIQIEDFLHYANLGKLKAKGQKLVWVKGHAGHPENERCDRLAVAESQKYRDAASGV